MPSCRYNQTPWRFKSLAFDENDMGSLGSEALSTIKQRISQGRNVEDAPAPPLSRNYERRKLRKGGAPIRDWTLTGQTMAALTATVVNSGEVEVSFGSLGSRQKLASLAAHNVGRRQMMGLSPLDKEKLSAVMDADFAAKVKRNA
jgi:hypothetical protein